MDRKGNPTRLSPVGVEEGKSCGSEPPLVRTLKLPQTSQLFAISERQIDYNITFIFQQHHSCIQHELSQ